MGNRLCLVSCPDPSLETHLSEVLWPKEETVCSERFICAPLSRGAEVLGKDGKTSEWRVVNTYVASWLHSTSTFHLQTIPGL